MGEYFKQGGLFDGIASVLIRCFWIGVAVLVIWTSAMLLAGESISLLQSQWFDITPQQASAIIYAGLAFFKLGVVGLFLVPYLAIRWTVSRNK